MSIVPLEPLPMDWREQLAARWPDGERLAWAWRLARDIETLSDLLAGLPVSADRVRPEELLRAERRSLVQLRAPIDLLPIKEAP